MSQISTSPDSTKTATATVNLATPYRVFDDRPFRVDGPILALAFNADGNLRSVEEPGMLRHWDLDGGCQRDWSFLTDLETVWTFNREGTLIGAASDELTVWDVGTGRLAGEWNQPSWVTALAFSPNSTQIATGHDDGSVRIWDVLTEQLVREIKGHSKPISALAYSADGGRLASAGEDKLIRLWDMTMGKSCGMLAGHTDRIPALAWHPSGQRLYSAGWDTTARVWDIATCDPIILLNSHHNQVFAMTLNAQGTMLACADAADRIHLWDVARHRTLQVLEIHEGEIRALAFSPDGRYLASGGEDRIIRLSTLDGKSATTAPLKKKAVEPAVVILNDFAVSSDVAVSPDGRHLAHISSTGLRLWNVESGSAAQQLENGQDLAALAYSPDGLWLAGGSGDAKLRLWNTKTGKQQGTLQGQDLPITAVAFAPDSKTLASSGKSGTDVWLWNISTVEPTLILPDAVAGSGVEALAFSPDGKVLAVGGVDWLATGGSDGRVCLWEIDKKGGPIATTEGGVTRLAFHPNGRWLAGATLNHTIRIWDIPSAKLHVEINDFEDMADALAFSGDGKWLASGGGDHGLRLWNTATFTLEGSLELDSQIKALGFSPDGRYLYTGNANGSCYQVLIQRILN